MRAIVAALLIALAGCATVQTVAGFLSQADLNRLATAACSGHKGVDSVKLQMTYALVNCRDGSLVTVEYFPAPAPTPKEEVK